MPRSKKPQTLKVVAGTDRKDREQPDAVDLPPVDKLPEPPDWMPNAHAVKEWKRLSKILMANNLLTEGDLGPLGHLCSLHGKICQLYAAGEAPTASMIGTMRNLQNDFGLTPVARGKVSPVDGSGKGKNAFGGNGRKKK